MCSVVLYGDEMWTKSATERRRFGSFEMWRYHRIMKILRVEKVSNEEVLARAVAEVENFGDISDTEEENTT